MAKYSQEFKLKVVQYYLSGFGRNQTGNKFGVHHSDVAKWVAIYDKYGAQGLSRKRTNTVYTPEFKFEVIQSVLKKGLSSRDAMLKFNLKTHAQVLDWLHHYQQYGIDGLKPKPKGRPKQMPPIKLSQEDHDKTQKQLLEELAYLRAENAFLKKLRALRLEQEAKEAVEQQHLQGLYQD